MYTCSPGDEVKAVTIRCLAIARQLTITKSGHYCHTKTSLVHVHVHVYDRV